jgi:RNA polymerase-binding transcription factor DksA
LQATRQHLERRLQETREELAQLDERLEAKGDYGLGRGDPLIVRWELNLALREKVEQRIEQLKEALERLDEGDYGICESCEQPIDPERLDVPPRTTLCITCAREAGQDGVASAPDVAQAGLGR